MDRRTLIRSGAGLAIGTTAAIMTAPAFADTSSDKIDEPLDFITDEMTTEDVAGILFEEASADERAAYVELADSRYPDLSPREQLRSILHSDAAAHDKNTAAVAPMALPLIPLAGIAARALIAAAKRYGPSVFNSLKTAVGKGYSAFNTWLSNHLFAGGIIVGVSGAAVYDILKEILF